MAQVTLRINGYAYTVGCKDGEEEHLQAMAGEVERRIDTVKAVAGQSGEARMLVMASLLMADDLYELNKGRQGGAPMPHWLSCPSTHARRCWCAATPVLEFTGSSGMCTIWACTTRSVSTPANRCSMRWRCCPPRRGGAPWMPMAALDKALTSPS